MMAFLMLLSGVTWTLVYIEAIRIGLRQQTYAIPVAALGLNFAWEWIYTVHGMMSHGQLQDWINLVWALADTFIVYTFFRYGKKEFPHLASKLMFVIAGIGLIAVSFAVQGLFIQEFGMKGMQAARYSAFLQNLLMSGLFIAMFIARRGARGQSLTIAIAKWIGTLAPTIIFGVLQDSSFILGIGLLCSLLDIIYIALLVVAKRSPQRIFSDIDRNTAQ